MLQKVLPYTVLWLKRSYKTRGVKPAYSDNKLINDANICPLKWLVGVYYKQQMLGGEGLDTRLHMINMIT